MILIIHHKRVRVSSDGIFIRSWFIVGQFMPFSEIDHSVAQVLAEPDWPVMLSIYGPSKSKLLGTIGLKAVRKEDAAWLCSLPQIKAVVHPGLTNLWRGTSGAK